MQFQAVRGDILENSNDYTNQFLEFGYNINRIIISNIMTCGKLVIKCPEGERGLWNSANLSRYPNQFLLFKTHENKDILNA